MRRLSGIDTAFLYLETPNIHMTVQAVMLLDPSTVPGGYSFEKIKAHLASRLPRLPEFRRRLASVPFDLHRPVWFDDPDFDFDYHVRHIAVPSPGSANQVADIVGDICGRSLDRSRPLWEFWVIEGVEHGAVVVVARMHHSSPSSPGRLRAPLPLGSLRCRLGPARAVCGKYPNRCNE